MVITIFFVTRLSGCKITIKINSKANINQVDCNINIKDNKVIKEMENKANKELALRNFDV